MRPVTDGDLSRLSMNQRLVILTDGVELLGMDSADRPVVRKKKWVDNNWHTWAILKNGDPTDVRE